MDSNTTDESKLVKNVINKLNIYMEKQQQNLFSLAKSMDFEYQPFYRLMKKNHLPTLSSLLLIAKQLRCTLQELISDNIFIDTYCISSINEMTSGTHKAICRVYMQAADYMPQIWRRKMFAVMNHSTQLLDLYYIVDEFATDGTFIVKHIQKTTIHEITSVSSKFVVVLINSEEVKIGNNDIKPIAKFYKSVKLLEDVSYGVIYE